MLAREGEKDKEKDEDFEKVKVTIFFFQSKTCFIQVYSFMVKANIIQKTFKLLPSKVQYKLFKFFFFFLTFFGFQL